MPDLKCQRCGREFGSEHGLKVHVGRAHGIRPEEKKPKPASVVQPVSPIAAGATCDICGRQFKLPLHLARHRKAAHRAKAERKIVRRRARRGKARRVAAAPAAATPASVPIGVDIASLAIDRLLDLKKAVDSRLAKIAAVLRRFRIKA